jgi:hypothetical protein
MPGGHKYYSCPYERCGKPLRKYQYESHVSKCCQKLGRASVGIKKEGRLSKTWLCCAPGCKKIFRTEKSCDKHIECCKHFDQPWDKGIGRMEGYPGDSGDEINGPIELPETEPALYVPVLYEYFKQLREYEQKFKSTVRVFK